MRLDPLKIGEEKKHQILDGVNERLRAFQQVEIPELHQEKAETEAGGIEIQV